MARVRERGSAQCSRNHATFPAPRLRIARTIRIHKARAIPEDVGNGRFAYVQRGATRISLRKPDDKSL